MGDPKSLATEIEAVLMNNLVFTIRQVPGGGYNVHVDVRPAVAKLSNIAALQSRAFEDGAKVDGVWLTPAQLRYLSRVSVNPAPIGAIGATQGAAEKLLRMGLWRAEQVRSNHRDRIYYRITDAGRAALAEQEKGDA